MVGGVLPSRSKLQFAKVEQIGVNVRMSGPERAFPLDIPQTIRAKYFPIKEVVLFVQFHQSLPPHPSGQSSENFSNLP